MQLVQEKVLDLDKPLIGYLDQSLVDYKIKGYRRGYQDLKDDQRYKKITGHNASGESYELMKWEEASAGGSMSTTLTDFTNFILP